MTNLSSLPGFSSGGSGGSGGTLPAVFNDVAVLVDYNGDYIRSSSHISQSSTTYQAFHPLSNDGTFGGIFDPYNSSNDGGPMACGFYVNPSNGSLGALQRASHMYNSGGGGHFSTCHHGSVGMMVMNNGHHMNPNYGTTHKGWIYGVGFNNDGSEASNGNGQGPHEYWPHSNGDMPCAANSATGRMWGRRSGYNQSTGTYYHNAFYYDHSNGGNGAQTDWQNASNTSTNYVSAAMKQSKTDLLPGGMLYWQDSSSNKRLACLHGASMDRGTEYDAYAYLGWTDSTQGYHLSNGETFWYYDGKMCSADASGNLTQRSGVEGAGFLQMINNRDSMQRTCVPTKDADTWIAATNGYGLMKFHIDPSDNYKITILGIFNTMAWLYDQSVSHSGKTLGLVGSDDEYLVYCSVKAGFAERYVYENPFAS